MSCMQSEVSFIQFCVCGSNLGILVRLLMLVYVQRNVDESCKLPDALPFPITELCN